MPEGSIPREEACVAWGGVFVLYVLHPIWFMELGWPLNFSSSRRGAHFAEGRGVEV